MTFYATIDTNVLLSGILKLKSGPGTLVLECLLGKIKPVLDKDGLILSEYNDVLYRAEFDFEPKIVEMIITGIEKRAIKIEPRELPRITGDYHYFPDETDIKFFTVTLGAASEYNTRLVTGNIHHFPSRKFIKTPREMLQLIKSDSNARNLELMQKAYTTNFFKGLINIKEHIKPENVSKALSIKRSKNKDVKIIKIIDKNIYHER